MKRRKAKKTARTDSATSKRDALRQFREHFDLSLENLADQSGLSRSMLSKFELGQRDLSPKAWARVLAAIRKLEAKREAERAKAKEEAAKFGVSMWHAFLGVDPQSPEYLRRYAEAGEYLRRREAEASLVEALSKESLLDYLKKVIQERDVLLTACEQMREWFGKFQKTLNAQNLTPEQEQAIAAELTPFVSYLQHAAKRLAAIGAEAKSSNLIPEN